MKNVVRYSFYVILFLLAYSAIAQKEKQAKKPSVASPAATMPSIPVNPVADARKRTAAPKEYADSAEFNKTFKEIYSLLKPKGTIREFAEKQVDRQLQALVRQGADSVAVVKAAYTGLDEDASYKIYFDTYREKLTAKELKVYLAFLKTPEGAKIQSVNMELNRAQAEVTRYVSQTVMTNLTPIRTAMQEKMMKENKAREEMLKTDTTDAGRRYRMQMQMRDSIMKARGITPPAPPKQ